MYFGAKSMLIVLSIGIFGAEHAGQMINPGYRLLRLLRLGSFFERLEIIWLVITFSAGIMLNSPDGTPTNAVYGFLTVLRRLLDEEKPELLCVAFDLKAPTFRHLQYGDYKAQRKPMPEDLAVQIPILKELLDAVGIRRLELEGFEADDIIGTVSRLCNESARECVIVTGDKDSFQLITESTRVKHDWFL